MDVEINNPVSCSFKTRSNPDYIDNIAELIIESGTFKNEVDLQLGFKMGQYSCLTVYTVEKQNNEMIQQARVLFNTDWI